MVGGYLSYIGLYCLQAGLSLMANVPLNSITDWGRLFHKDIIILMTPGLLVGVVMLVVSRRVRHFLALPVLLLAIPALFFVVVYAAGYTLDDARSAYDGRGWVGEASKASDFRRTWDGFKFSRVHWHVVPSVLPTWLAMYFVVAFSSCLDVAAIQMELGRPLDFNHELKTVGISNLASGLTGGQTGSYIFSQTIFTMRAGVRTRVQAVVIIFFCLIMFCLPLSLMAYIPKLFFGGVLAYIAYDLLLDWLYASFKLVSRLEYAIVWGTLIAITALNNLEFGFLVGVGLCLLAFIFQYSSQPTGVKVRRHSNVIRGYRQRQLLAKEHKGIVCMELSGYIFFGRAVGLLKEVERNVVVYTDAATHPPPALSGLKQTSSSMASGGSGRVMAPRAAGAGGGDERSGHLSGPLAVDGAGSDEYGESDDSEAVTPENSAYPRSTVAINIGGADRSEGAGWGSFSQQQKRAGGESSAADATSTRPGRSESIRKRQSMSMAKPVLVHLSSVSAGQQSAARQA